MFGFAPHFILPADKQDVKYDLSIAKNDDNKNALKIVNKGNTIMAVLTDQCAQSKGKDKDKCTDHRFVYNGRTVTMDLPQSYKRGMLKVKVLIGDEKYQEDYVL